MQFSYSKFIDFILTHIDYFYAIIHNFNPSLKGGEKPEYNYHTMSNASETEDKRPVEAFWYPISNTSTNFTSHRLSVDGDIASFKPTKILYFFTYLFFGVFGLVAYFGLGSDEMAEYLSPQLLQIIRPVVIIAIAGGLFMLNRKLASPIVFDKNSGWFWKGYTSPDLVMNPGELKDAAQIKDIRKIQILSKRSRGSNNRNSYECYELNLVLADTSRVNVVTHGGSFSMMNDADELAAFLNVPVIGKQHIWV